MSDLISRQKAIDLAKDLIIPKSDYLQNNQAVNNYAAELVRLPSAEPEPEWGLPVSINRPLSDREIIPRLRAIQRQIGGSYAIDRAVEVIEAIAKRRTDDGE